MCIFCEHSFHCCDSYTFNTRHNSVDILEQKTRIGLNCAEWHQFQFFGQNVQKIVLGFFLVFVYFYITLCLKKIINMVTVIIV